MPQGVQIEIYSNSFDWVQGKTYFDNIFRFFNRGFESLSRQCSLCHHLMNNKKVSLVDLLKVLLNEFNYRLLLFGFSILSLTRFVYFRSDYTSF